VNTANITAPAVTQNTAIGTSTLATCSTPTPTGTGTSTATAGPSGTPTATGTATATASATATATASPTPSIADLDTAGLEGTDTLVAPNWTSQRVLRLANDGNTAIGLVSLTETVGGTAARATLTVSAAGGLGTVCAVTGIVTDPTQNVVCSFGLAADNGTVGDNDTNGPADGDTAVITITATGATGVAGQTVTYTAVTPACSTPGPCTSGVVSPANSDGGVTIIPADTDTLVAAFGDLDTSWCNNVAQTICANAGGQENAAFVSVPNEDLSLGGGAPGWTSQSVYFLNNNGNSPIQNPPCPPTNCGVFVTGTIPNTGTSAVYTGGVLSPGVAFNVITTGTTSSVCTQNVVAVPITWRCDADLAANNAGTTDELVILVQVTGTSGAAGQTIDYTAAAPDCSFSGGACTDGVVSPNNNNGSDTTPGVGPNGWPSHTDTLVP